MKNLNLNIKFLLTHPIYQDANKSWEILMQRYPSKGKYKQRQVISDYQNKKHQLYLWLESLGFECSFSNTSSEQIRFKDGKYLGIIYESGTGNLIAHDVCAKFQG